MTLLKFRTLISKVTVALPCHFDPGQFTSGAIDNWDHEGANVSEHDTVTVLYQDKSSSSLCKPKMSETQVTHGPQAFKEIMPCQVLLEFQKPVTRPDISPTYTVSKETFSSNEAKLAKQKNLAWSLARLDAKGDSITMYPESQAMPLWSASNAV